MLRMKSLVASLVALLLLPTAGESAYVSRSKHGTRYYSDVCPAGTTCKEVKRHRSRPDYSAPAPAESDTTTTATDAGSDTTTTTSDTGTSPADAGSTSTATDGGTATDGSADATSTASNDTSSTSSDTTSSSSSGSTPASDPGGAPAIGGVTGSFANGKNFTIAGTAFGSKSHAGPMLYDDFDNASATNINGREPEIHQGYLSQYGSWIRTAVGSGAPQIVRDSSGTRPLSNYHARMDFSGGWSSLYLTVDPVGYFKTGQEMYISFWYRYRKTGSSHPRQTKAWIAYPPTGSDKAYFSTAFDTCESGGWRMHRSEGGFTDRSFGMSGPEVDGEWIRIETYLKQSAPSTANGAWEQAVYRTSTPRRITASLGNAQMRTSSADWTFWGFGGTYYSSCGSSPGTIGDFLGQHEVRAAGGERVDRHVDRGDPASGTAGCGDRLCLRHQRVRQGERGGVSDLDLALR
jgi:hypothetical protein